MDSLRERIVARLSPRDRVCVRSKCNREYDRMYQHPLSFGKNQRPSASLYFPFFGCLIFVMSLLSRVIGLTSNNFKGAFKAPLLWFD